MRQPAIFFLALLLSLQLHAAATVDSKDRQYKMSPLKPTPVIGVGKHRVTPATEPAVNTPAPELDVKQLDELIALKLPALALQIIIQHQQQTRRFSPDWYKLERKRTSVLVLLERWDETIARVQAAITGNPDIGYMPAELIDWFRTQQAIAYLKSGDQDGALHLLGQLIWSDAQYDRKQVFALWRRLVISAYLQQDNIKDAESAMLRYDYDYRSSDFALTEDWKYTRAGVLLRLDRNQEVMKLMSAQASPLEMQYYMLAQLRHDKTTANAITRKIASLTNGVIISKSDRWAFRYLEYEAALSTEDDKKITAALQDLLSVGKASHSLQHIVDVDADDWWQRYRDKGDALGNHYRLLRGDDSAWYARAIELRKTNTDKAISLLVALALRSRVIDHRQLAHAELISILEKRKNSMDLLLQLYLYSDVITDLNVVPVNSRAQLIDHALDKKDITQAARLMQSLQQVPDDQDPFVWQLRKARVLVLEGEYEAGETVLSELFAALPQLDEDKLDRIMQVLFDLQSVQRHEAALTFFGKIAKLDIDFQLRRELFFWMAQSNQALSHYATAAMNYLRSARTEDGGMNDQWALSSRLKAAGVLVKAGLFDDAETLYRRLLKITANESRKAMIEQEMQQIYLLRNASKSARETARKTARP